MNTEQQRIALARWMGWTNHQMVLYPLPNYPASLDACHEVICKLRVGLDRHNPRLKAYRDELAKIIGCAWYQSAEVWND